VKHSYFMPTTWFRYWSYVHPTFIFRSNCNFLPVEKIWQQGKEWGTIIIMGTKKMPIFRRHWKIFNPLFLLAYL